MTEASGENHGSRAKLLVLCTFIPFPAHRGDPVRVLGLLEAFAAEADLTVLCLEDGGDADGLRRALPGAEVRTFQPSRLRRLGFVSDLLRLTESLIRGIPSWMLKSQSEDLSRAASEAQATVDGVVVFGESAAQYAGGLSRQWHWDKFNVQTFSLGAEFRQLRNGPAKAKVWVDLVATRRYERRGAVNATSISVTNADEAARFSSTFGREALVLHSTVPVPPEAPRRPEEGRLLWLGNLSYRSNRDGLFRFLHGSWPALEDRFMLRVVGSDMSEDDRRALHDFTNVEPVGFVRDLAPEFEKAALGIVPLWSGGGTKMKTLTMLSSGLPVVSTPSGAEGIGSDALHVADTPEGLAAQIVSVAASVKRSVTFGEAGRAVVIRDFSTGGPTVQQQLAEVMNAVVGRTPSGPRF